MAGGSHTGAAREPQKNYNGRLARVAVAIPSFFPFASLASHEAAEAQAVRDMLENEGSERDVEEIPYYDGNTWNEIDWSDADFDDVYDDVGDEDEDQYGEDAT